MIIKSLSRKSNTGQLIKYVLRYTLKENEPQKVKENATIVLRHNLRSRSIKNYIQEFKENESYRIYKRKDSVTLFHSILSFSPCDKEKITNTHLKNISKKFVELRGINNLYLAVAHKEKAHIHLHIVMSGVQVNGYSSRVSKQQFKHIKLELEKYQQQKFPELNHSAIDHDKKRQKSKEDIIEQVKSSRQTEKQKLASILETAFNQSKSSGEFITFIKSKSYEPYYRNNNLQGIKIDGQKFRLQRLGYDAKKIEELNHKSAIEKNVYQEFADLRSGRNKLDRREILTSDKTEDNKDSAGQKELDELTSLRNQNVLGDLQKDQKDIDRNDAFEERGEFEDENQIKR